MINREQFGRRIRILRKKVGLSQALLAEKLNVSTQAVSKWECGTALPDIDILLELSWLFEITVNNLLEDGESFSNTKIMTRSMLPDSINAVVKEKGQQKLISSISSYFSETELLEPLKKIANGSLRLNCNISAIDDKMEYEKSSIIPLSSLSEVCLKLLSFVISELFAAWLVVLTED